MQQHITLAIKNHQNKNKTTQKHKNRLNNQNSKTPISAYPTLDHINPKSLNPKWVLEYA